MGIYKGSDLKDFSGNIDKLIVVRQFGDRTILSKYPDMSNIVPSARQKLQRSSFAEAQQLAKELYADPLRKARFIAENPGIKRPYNVLVSYIMKNGKAPY
ncbi:MAG: hypothetical protein EOO04_30375 [Chitinophagaceae bacterium]|nr:MAG: hypothetical protein EOO04_30375 [Chitinophagaceae bacterium]